jgi:uncharacterized protein (TIGR03086 family)
MPDPTTPETAETADRYRRLAASFADRIRAVPDGAWTRPSPCEGWTALDVVRHVTEAPGFILGMAGREIGPIPPVDDDPLAAFVAASAAVQACLDDPAVAGIEFEGFFGPTTLSVAIDRFVCFDLVVHAWDLARATGTDERLDPDDVVRVRAAAESFGPTIRSPQVCGPEVEPPPGADEQTRLLAFLGRTA